MSDLDERFRSAAQACHDTVVWHSQRGPAETMNGAALDKDPATVAGWYADRVSPMA